jgi:hypothetical protein
MASRALLNEVSLVQLQRWVKQCNRKAGRVWRVRVLHF